VVDFAGGDFGGVKPSSDLSSSNQQLAHLAQGVG